jgi:hypothetical protein
MEGTLLLLLYFVPTFVAISRDTPNKGSAIVVNVFLGWTIIGWVVALSMAFGKTDKTMSIPNEKFNLPPLPQQVGNSSDAKTELSILLKKLKWPITIKGKIFAISSVLAAAVLLGFFVYENYLKAGPRFSYNVTGEGWFGSSTNPEEDDVSYLKVRKLTDSAGVESYYFVMEITNFSSETSSYAINVALVCDGRKKFQDDFLIKGLSPSESRSKELRISNELKVDRCTATVSVSRDAS